MTDISSEGFQGVEHQPESAPISCIPNIGRSDSTLAAWLSVRGSVSVGGHNEGVLASLGVEAKYHPTQRLTLTIGPEVTWINNQYAMTFFGIDAAQSEIAGIAPYRARSGIDFLGGSAGASYILTDHWSLAAHVSYGRLQGDAANSPVTTDKTQRVYGAFVMYRF